MSSNISNDIKILEAAIRSFPDIEIVCYNNTLGTMDAIIIPKDRNCFDRALEYGMDFGYEIDKSVTIAGLLPIAEEDLVARKARNLSIMEIKNYSMDSPLVQRDFDYLSGKRKGKYSKYHKNNRFHK